MAEIICVTWLAPELCHRIPYAWIRQVRKERRSNVADRPCRNVITSLSLSNVKDNHEQRSAVENVRLKKGSRMDDNISRIRIVLGVKLFHSRHIQYTDKLNALLKIKRLSVGLLSHVVHLRKELSKTGIWHMNVCTNFVSDLRNQLAQMAYIWKTGFEILKLEGFMYPWTDGWTTLTHAYLNY